MSSRLSFVRKAWQNFADFNGYDKLVAEKLTITHASEGKITCELPIEKMHLNRASGLHGGFTSTLVDIGGSLAIAAKGMNATGVSTDLNVSFINAAKEGDIIVMDAECVKLGKTLAFTVVDLKSKQSNKLIAQGRHTKFVAIAHKDPENLINIGEQ